MNNASDRSVVAEADGGPADHRQRRPLVTWLLAGVLIILAGWTLKAAASVVVPVVAALFIALAVAPVDSSVRKRVPDRLTWLGHAAAMTIVVLVLATFFAGIYLAARQAADQLPDLPSEIGAALPGGSDATSAASDDSRDPVRFDSDSLIPQASERSGDGALGDAGSRILGVAVDWQALVQRGVAYIAEHASYYGRTVLTATAGVVGGLVLIFFLVLLMLVEGPVWREKIKNAVGSENGTRWNDAFATIAKRFRRFLIVRTILGAITALLYILWLSFFNIGLLVVWGVLTLLLNYIPTLGSIIAGALPILYALITTDWTTALIVAAGIIVIEQVMGNYVDPRMQGKQLSVSPLVTFVALLLFGWMWGVVGALLAVPLAVFVVIVCAHTPSLRPVGLLLSDKRNEEALREATSA